MLLSHYLLLHFIFFPLSGFVTVVVVSPTSLTSLRITERIYISTRVTHTAITSLTIAQQYIIFIICIGRADSWDLQRKVFIDFFFRRGWVRIRIRREEIYFFSSGGHSCGIGSKNCREGETNEWIRGPFSLIPNVAASIRSTYIFRDMARVVTPIDPKGNTPPPPLFPLLCWYARCKKVSSMCRQQCWPIRGLSIHFSP